MLPGREKPTPLRLVTLRDQCHGHVAHPQFEAFRLFETGSQRLTFVRLKPGGRYGDVRDLRRVWTVTVIQGQAVVKVGRKRLLVEPCETAVIESGPARSIANPSALNAAECLIAAFLVE
jgi:hypothetical protein